MMEYNAVIQWNDTKESVEVIITTNDIGSGDDYIFYYFKSIQEIEQFKNFGVEEFRIISYEPRLTDDESDGFFENYKPIYNHIEHKQYKERQTKGNNIGADMYFETYGEDLKYVQYHDPQFIWTLIEIDDVQYIVQGFHYVNRMNYFIASVPYTGGQEEFLYMDFKQLNY